jgi:hypothetical protein
MEPLRDQVALLDTIDSVDFHDAQLVIAEYGANMSHS